MKLAWSALLYAFVAGAAAAVAALPRFALEPTLQARGTYALIALTAAIMIWYQLRRSRGDDAALPLPPAASGPPAVARGELLATLAAGLAHELGQPLSAARVGIEGLHYLRQLGREPSPEHIERTLSRIGMSIIAMTQTIEHLRGLANPHQDGEMSVLDLAGCVEAVLAERDQWLRYSDTRIAWTRPALPSRALGNAAGVRLILVNLLRNAVEAVSGQGEDRRLVRLAAGPGPVITVHDSGAGIQGENLTQLFDPFFSTKAGAMRGIGLSLAQASANRMGAELSVVSTLGSGTSFTVRLRDAPPDAGLPA